MTVAQVITQAEPPIAAAKTLEAKAEPEPETKADPKAPESKPKSKPEPEKERWPSVARWIAAHV